MKTRLVLKKKYRDALKKIICVLILVFLFMLCVKALDEVDKSERRNAIKRCGGEDNIVEKYTSTGDVYYACKEQ